MNGRRRRGVALSLLLVAAAVVAVTAARAGPNVRIKPPKGSVPIAGRHKVHVKRSVLMVLRSPGGTLKPLGHGRYALTLRGLDLQSVAFTDRPGRQAAVVNTTILLKSWRSAFKSSPPNAALVLPGAKVNRDTFVFELGPPKVDVAHRSATFTARILTSPPARLAYLKSRVDKTPPRSFGSASLFVDDDDSVNTSYCGAGIQNNSPYTLYTNGSPLYDQWTLADGGDLDYNGEEEIQSDVVPSTSIASKKTGSGGVMESDRFYIGCAMSIVFNSLPRNPDGTSQNGDIGIYVEYDYTGANQYECVSTGALNISCRFVQSGDQLSPWMSSALNAVALGVAGVGLDAVSAIEAASTGSVSVEATITTRGGSQFPVCQASSGHQGCPTLLGGD